MNNIDIINAIRAASTAQFQERIPVATQGNIADIGTAIMRDVFELNNNEFLDNLMNMIAMTVFKQKMLRNKLAPFKTGNNPFGDTIREIGVDIQKGETFEQGKNPFETGKANVLEMFHRLNRQDVYRVHVSWAMLTSAFTDGGGLQNLMDKMVSALYSSANMDEWLCMKNLFSQYINAPTMPLKSEQIWDGSVKPTDRDTANNFLIDIKQAVAALSFPSDKLNPAGFMLDSEGMTAFVRSDIMPVVDTLSLAAAFQLDKAAPPATILTLDDFGDNTDDVLAVITNRDWFMVYDKLQTLASIANPADLTHHYHLHIWQYLSLSYMVNAIIIKAA